MSESRWLSTSYAHPDSLEPERWEKLSLSREQYLEWYEPMVRERALRDKAAPRVGELAPDFKIERLTPEGVRSRETFHLSSVRGKPVALVFGSYT